MERTKRQLEEIRTEILDLAETWDASRSRCMALVTELDDHLPADTEAFESDRECPPVPWVVQGGLSRLIDEAEDLVRVCRATATVTPETVRRDREERLAELRAVVEKAVGRLLGQCGALREEVDRVRGYLDAWQPPAGEEPGELPHGPPPGELPVEVRKAVQLSEVKQALVRAEILLRQVGLASE